MLTSQNELSSLSISRIQIASASLKKFALLTPNITGKIKLHSEAAQLYFVRVHVFVSFFEYYNCSIIFLVPLNISSFDGNITRSRSATTRTIIGLIIETEYDLRFEEEYIFLISSPKSILFIFLLTSLISVSFNKKFAACSVNTSLNTLNIISASSSINSSRIALAALEPIDPVTTAPTPPTIAPAIPPIGPNAHDAAAIVPKYPAVPAPTLAAVVVTFLNNCRHLYTLCTHFAIL